MYSIEDQFLYEIMEDYQKEKDSAKKREIFDAFMKKLWSVPLRRRKYTKNLSYQVEEDLQDELAKVFRQFEKVSYLAYVSKTHHQGPWFLLRQKINNLYTFLCDPEICFKKDYMTLLTSAKTYYYRYINGEFNQSAQQLWNMLTNNLARAATLKTSYEKRKILISWHQYKKKITEFMLHIFQNYIPMDQLQAMKQQKQAEQLHEPCRSANQWDDEEQWNLEIDFWSEDNYVIKYIGKSLCGYMKNYQKEYLHLRQHQKYGVCHCGRLFEKHNNRHKYCAVCARQRVREYDRSRKATLRSV